MTETRDTIQDAINSKRKRISLGGLSLAKRSHEFLVELGEIDPVTGVGNYKALNKWLARDNVVENARPDLKTERRKSGIDYLAFGVAIFLDADGLGKANSISHQFGDKLLIAVANAGRDIANRPTDVIFRRGDRSDEFVIFLPGDTSEVFESLEKRYNNAIAEISGENNFSASLAIGEYGKGVSASDVINKLDERLSEAKKDRPKGNHIPTIFYRNNV